ncbi:protein EARLY-RESPONSIVE TO DEHYDRATION 7, chloroplastic-like [Macadamia integrifolia]|uniref:protein EARLY-RESPONSIVE TO DEHYDRATION 7, chloroplastic-like n=1 Tax=Macadamia integrifolia TaxID=60698 RepID=UPI001C4EA047|nr:protein EARLY-RESPONSIVE TO DEHYDRATION 7, chloroplastic-like [Macadamia integrifolia]
MASKNPQNHSSLYPQIIESNPEATSPFLSSNTKSSSMYPEVGSLDPSKDLKPSSSSSSSLYPSLDMRDLVENLFPDNDESVKNPNSQSPSSASAPVESVEEVLIKVQGAIVHLIDKQYSVELANGELTIVRLRQGENVVAILVRIGDEIQWPLAKDEPAVKLDDSHYFFSLRFPTGDGSDSGEDEKHGNDESENLLNYGLTIASKGQESLLKELDGILEHYSAFSVQKVSGKEAQSEVLDGSVAKAIAPSELKSEKKKEEMKERSAAYWTTLAPNVEDYSGTISKGIAAGSGQVIRGILWCGDVTVDRLKWGNEILQKRMGPATDKEISPQTLKRIKRVKKMTKMSEKVATGVLSGVVKVSGFFTSTIVNSKAGKKFFSLLPGEIVLASLDGFNKVCDAVEVAGKNVMSTSSVVTTGLVSQRYGEKAGEATNEGLDAAGHAIGTAWAVFKIRKALNPKSSLKASSLAKSAVKAKAAEVKAKNSK